jgi:hypothetical protein
LNLTADCCSLGRLSLAAVAGPRSQSTAMTSREFGPVRDYQIRRLERERQRRDHLADPPKGCRCVDCVGVEGVAAVFQQIKAAEIRRTGPAPF